MRGNTVVGQAQLQGKRPDSEVAAWGAHMLFPCSAACVADRPGHNSDVGGDPQIDMWGSIAVLALLWVVMRRWANDASCLS